jgi:hypothetical protein
MRIIIASLFCAVLLVVVVGCGGGHQTVVTISPRPATVEVGTVVAFTANIQHNHKSGLGVNWSLIGAGSLGNVTPLSVDYNAPADVPMNPSVTISAVSQEGATATDSVTFTLQ